jgi:hypothetical protein
MFRKFAVITMTAVVCFLAAGCYSVKLSALPDADVKLLPETKSTTFKKSVKTWYLLGGLVPLSSKDKVGKVIKDNNLTEVRLETKMKFFDFLITGVTWYILGRYTTVIEGNAGSVSSSGSYSAPSSNDDSGSYDSGESSPDDE